MANCKNCGDWCKEEYKYCWTCNQSIVEHPCIKCGATIFSERWKTTCRSCWKDSLNSSDYSKSKRKKGYEQSYKEQSKLSDFF